MTAFLARTASTACRRLCLLAAFVLIAGCQSVYFHDAGAPPAPLVHPLDRLPFTEYWTGIVFNGEKIGFTRYTIRPAARKPGHYEVLSEASFVLRFLGIEKSINLKSRDLIAADLTLVDFDYDYTIDGSALKLAGVLEAGKLNVSMVSGGKPAAETYSHDGKLYPTSVTALYPVVHGISLQREYEYPVYDGQTQTIARVQQKVLGYESSRFFEGNAFKLETTLHGQNATTWIDARGRPVFELGMRGAMISALEDEASARRYLALAALNKQEALIEFSVIRPEPPLADPRRAARMVVEIEGLDRPAPSDAWQRCRREAGRDTCEIVTARPGASSGANAPLEKYVLPSITVQSNDPNIRVTAGEIAGGAAAPRERIARLLKWMDANIEKAPIDVFSALDVLEKRKAECQGHAYLYTALARAMNVPTRVVNGLAYSETLKGFLYHSWVESLVDGHWLPIDPTFSQPVADATHIKLLEGERLSDLLPLIDWVGKLKLRVLALEHDR